MVTPWVVQGAIEHIYVYHRYFCSKLWFNISVKKQPWRRPRIPAAARHARSELVQTLTSTIAKNAADGKSVRQIAGKLGTVTVQRGLASPGTLEANTVVIALVDRYKVTGERLVNIYQRAGSVSVTHIEVPIEPFEPNLFLLKDQPASTVADNELIRRIQGVTYSVEEARNAAAQLLRTPQLFGIAYYQIYDAQPPDFR